MNGFVEILSTQQQEFINYISSLKSISSDIEGQLKLHNDKTKLINKKIEELDNLKLEIEKIKKIQESNLRESQIYLDSAKNKENTLNLELYKSESLKKSLVTQEESLQSQREELIKREQDIQRRMSWVEVEERSIRATRMAVDKLIKDSKLKEILGE